MNLENLPALVTGGGSGMGAVTAQMLSGRGARVAVLDRERDFELESLNSDYEHQLNVKSIDQEIEIASLSNNKSSQQLIAELEQQKLQEDAYRAKQRDDWDHWRNKQTVKRDDDWDSLLHARRKEDIETELAVQAAERKTRVALIEHELASRLENDQFEREKRRKAWELDVEKQDSDNAIDLEQLPSQG